MIRGEVLGSRFNNCKKKCTCKQDDCWEVFEECKNSMRNVIILVYKELEMNLRN